MERILNSWFCVLYFDEMGKGPGQMKHPAAIISAMCLMDLLSFSHAEAASEELVATVSSTEGAIGKVDPSALKRDVVSRAPAVPLESSTPSEVFRDIPSISADYSVGGTTLRSYIAAGVGCGCTSADIVPNESMSPPILCFP